MTLILWSVLSANSCMCCGSRGRAPHASSALQDGSDLPAVNSSASGGSSRVKKGGAGPRKATPQRKQNNRKAQQRYREKRKMQAVEREEQVCTARSAQHAQRSTRLAYVAQAACWCSLRDWMGHICGMQLSHVTQFCAASCSGGWRLRLDCLLVVPSVCGVHLAMATWSAVFPGMAGCAC